MPRDASLALSDLPVLIHVAIYQRQRLCAIGHGNSVSLFIGRQLYSEVKDLEGNNYRKEDLYPRDGGKEIRI